MKSKCFAASALALALGTGPGLARAQAYGGQQAPPPPGYEQGAYPQGQWDAPPQEFRDAERRGFHDGIEGARRDVDNRRQPNVNNREEYRHPRVDRSMRREYREGFRRGYDTAVRHMMSDNRDHEHHEHDRDDRDRYDPH